jgi:single-strand DNA-binding protein
MALCKVMIIGNLGADPEMRYTPSGRPVTQFNVAVNQSTKNQQTGEWNEETDWFRVSIWGDRAERAAETFRKGNKVFVEGRFKTREFEGRDGQKRTSLEITADSLVNLEKRNRDEGEGGQFTAAAPAGAVAGASGGGPAASGGRGNGGGGGNFDEGELDDLPFCPSFFTYNPILTTRCGPRAAEFQETNPHAAHQIKETRRLLPRPTPQEGLRVLRRQDCLDRLQGGQPPPPLPIGAGEDRAASEDRNVRRAPARARRGPEAGADRRPAAVRTPAPPTLSSARP